MSYTPGPWRQNGLFIEGGSRPDQRICYAYGAYTDCADAEAKANARLIAAAPELLEALREILAHVESDTTQLIAGQCTLCHTYRIIGHAAIAKAEGRDTPCLMQEDGHPLMVTDTEDPRDL